MRMEELLDVSERWMSESLQWQVAEKYNKTREFQRAVDKLEALVVQRLFELTKANLSGTGMLQFSKGSMMWSLYNQK